MKKYLYLAALVVLWGMCALPSWAQLDGTIRGVVKGPDGKPIAGAVIQLYEPSTGRRYSGKTNGKGEYVIGTVYQGTYKGTLLVNGNPVDEKSSIGLGAGQEQIVDWNEGGGGPGLTEEQKQKIAAEKKENEKIKGLNASLLQAKQLEGAGNYDQAITLLTQATQVDPGQDLVWAYLGDAQRGAAAHSTDAQTKTKDYQDAAASYQKAITIKPTAAAYHAGLADAYAKTGQADKAVAEYDAAAQADPTNASAYYYNEGVVLTNSNKTDEAVAAFDKSIAADPKRADAYYQKGVNLIGKATNKGDKMIAPPGTAEAFQKYLELEPTGKYADAAKQMLAAIGAPVETSYGKTKKK